MNSFQKFRQAVVEILHRIAYPLARVWWFIARPTTFGVKLVVLDGDKVLLVRPNYAHRQFTIPGGGLKKGEDPAKAAEREVLEETGVRVKNIRKIGEYSTVVEYKNDTVYAFVAEADTTEISPAWLEVAEAGWFPLAALPADRVSRVDKLLEMTS